MQLFTYKSVSTLPGGRQITGVLEGMFLSRAVFEAFLEMENAKSKPGSHTDFVYTEWTSDDSDLLSKWHGLSVFIDEDDICAVVETGEEPWPAIPNPSDIDHSQTRILPEGY